VNHNINEKCKMGFISVDVDVIEMYRTVQSIASECRPIVVLHSLFYVYDRLIMLMCFSLIVYAAEHCNLVICCYCV